VAELLIVLVVVLLLVGATRIPQLARNAGRAKAELKGGGTDFDPVRPDPDPPPPGD